MLVLKRAIGQVIIINGDIRILILNIENGKVKVGIEAPDEVDIVREELLSQEYKGQQKQD